MCLEDRLLELESNFWRLSSGKYIDNLFHELLRDVNDYLNFVKSIVDEVIGRDDDVSPEISKSISVLRRTLQQVLVRKVTILRKRINDNIYSNSEVNLIETTVADLKLWVKRVQGANGGIDIDVPSEDILRVF
jgi:hypothetical protein